MSRISENLRTINIKGLTPTGNLVNDVEQLCKLNGRNPAAMPQGMPLVLALRIKLGDPLTVHVLTEAVCKKVQRVKIVNLPSEYPAFLKTPFFIESKPGNVLFDDIDAIGGFIDNNDFILVMWAKNGTYFTKTETPFKGIRLDKITYVPRQDGITPPSADQNKNVFPFITVLALMLEAEKTPILVDHGTKKSKKRNISKNKNIDISDWVEKRILIDAKYSKETENAVKDTQSKTSLNKTGKEKKDVHVQGFLRYQAYGPEHSLRKWIYIEDYPSTRWKKTGDIKITVDAYFN